METSSNQSWRQRLWLMVSLGLCWLINPGAKLPALADQNIEKATAQPTYTNPVVDFDSPDPCILRVKNRFYMLHTKGGVPAWPLYESSDMVHWHFLKNLLTEANKPAWIRDSLWAPELHRIGATFVLTFTAHSNLNDRLCIGMATSDAIDGPYVVQTAPIIQDDVAVIDSHIFLDDDGKNYLVWKRDGPHGGVGGSIRLRQLDNMGTNFAADTKEVVLLTSDKDSGQPWEQGLIEAPWMLKRDGWYYLVYSGAFIGLDLSYREGVARSRSLESPFERFDGNPIMGNNERYGGTGHGAFEMDSAGDLWHLYHARDKIAPGGRRDKISGKGRIELLDRVIYKNGWPTFGNNGSPATSPQPAPKLGDFPPYVWLMEKDDLILHCAMELIAGAEDDKGIRNVEFFLSGWSEQPIGKARQRDGECKLDWDTSKVSNGDYRVFAKATDTGGHTATSRSLTVTVAN